MSTVSDVVRAPDFPSVEQAEQRLNSELELRARTVGEDSPALLGTMDLLLNLYKVWHANNPADTQAKADALMSRMIAIANTDETRYSWVYSSCGMFCYETGQNAKALPLHERALRLDEASLGERHVNVMLGLNNLASVLSRQGKYDLAEPLYERGLRLRLEVRVRWAPLLLPTTRIGHRRVRPGEPLPKVHGLQVLIAVGHLDRWRQRRCWHHVRCWRGFRRWFFC